MRVVNIKAETPFKMEVSHDTITLFIKRERFVCLYPKLEGSLLDCPDFVSVSLANVLMMNRK